MTGPSLPSLPPPPPASAPKSTSRAPGISAFTLLELLLVITIIAILASLLLPSLGEVRSRADSISCSNNLRTLGAAVQLYLQDHNQNYPAIDSAVPPSIYPQGFPTQTMLQAFGPYGVTTSTLQCPTDIKQGANSSYVKYQNSYDWKPTLDDENTSEPLVYGRRMGFGAALSGTAAATGIIVKLSKVRQVFDDTQIHFGHMNALYADGHVIYFTAPTTAAH